MGVTPGAGRDGPPGVLPVRPVQVSGVGGGALVEVAVQLHRANRGRLGVLVLDAQVRDVIGVVPVELRVVITPVQDGPEAAGAQVLPGGGLGEVVDGDQVGVAAVADPGQQRVVLGVETAGGAAAGADRPAGPAEVIVPDDPDDIDRGGVPGGQGSAVLLPLGGGEAGQRGTRGAVGVVPDIQHAGHAVAGAGGEEIIDPGPERGVKVDGSRGGYAHGGPGGPVDGERPHSVVGMAVIERAAVDRVTQGVQVDRGVALAAAVIAVPVDV